MKQRKPKRPRKKIVLFLVEGRSDREILQSVISSLYARIDPSIEVFFPIISDGNGEIGGDITSRIGVNPKRIQSEIYEHFLRDFFDREKILPKDIQEVVQIVDMDGVYIPDESIYVGPSPRNDGRYYYEDDRIIVPDFESAQRRNCRKRENLDFLIGSDTIKVKQKTVSYSIYYFSCNLDHYIHQERNLDMRSKCALANNFVSNYALATDEGIDRLVDLFCNDPNACIGSTYQESWNYIREGLHSLSCRSNLNILFERLQRDTQAAKEAEGCPL